MIGTIRKHSKWLWGVIITVVIVTFVFWGSSSNSGNSKGKVNFGSVDDEPISQEAYVNAAREAWLDFFLNYGPNSRANFDEQRLTYQRLFWIKKLKDYNIQVDEASAVRAADEILRANGLTLEKFGDMTKQNANLADFERYLRHQLGIQQLITVVGLSSDLVTMPEVEALYRRDYQELVTEAAFFAATNYASLVAPPAPETIKSFYEAHQAEYRFNERVQVSYIKFDATNFLADADAELAKMTNLNERVEQVYRQRGTNYYADAKSPEEAKRRILADARHDMALEAARRKADRLAEQLLDMKPTRPGNLAAVAATNGFVVKNTAPFEEHIGPAEFDMGLNFARAAFVLTAEEPFTEQPVHDGDAYFLLALDKRIPSEIPPLALIQDRVVADYKHQQAILLARRAGTHLAESLTNGLAQGKTFAALSADAKVKSVAVPPMSLGTRTLSEVEDHVSLYEYKRVAFNTPVGKPSSFVETEDGGIVVYVRQLLPLDEAKMKTDMPTFIKTVRQARRQESVNAWFQREAAKSLRDTPLAQQQNPSMPSGSPPRRS